MLAECYASIPALDFEEEFKFDIARYISGKEKASIM